MADEPKVVVPAVGASARRWVPRAGAAVADQGLVSGANFLVSIVLARLLEPSAYGAYGIAFSVYLFAFGIHSALIQEPMSVLAPARGTARSKTYLRAMLRFHVVLTACLAGAVLLGAVVIRSWSLPLAEVLTGMAACLPVTLLFYLYRRLAYVRGQVTLALAGAVVYGVAAAGSLWLLEAAGAISMMTAFLPFAVGSLAAAVFVAARTRNASADGTEPIGGVVSDAFRYGRWVVASAVVYWFATYVYQPLIGASVGLAEAGVYRAMLNLVLPLTQVMTALGLLLLPHVAGMRAKGGTAYVRNTLPRLMAVNIAVGVVYLACLVAFGPALSRLLYGAGRYGEYVWLAVYLGVTQLVAAARQALYIAVKAVERPDRVFWAQSVGALVTMTLGVWAVMELGLLGAGIGQLVSTAAETAVLWWLAGTAIGSRTAMDGRNVETHRQASECG